MNQLKRKQINYRKGSRSNTTLTGNDNKDTFVYDKVTAKIKQHSNPAIFRRRYVRIPQPLSPAVGNNNPDIKCTKKVIQFRFQKNVGGEFYYSDKLELLSRFPRYCLNGDLPERNKPVVKILK